MIREMTDCKTAYVTKVVNKMRSQVLQHMQEFHSEGQIVKNENKFFTYNK